MPTRYLFYLSQILIFIKNRQGFLFKDNNTLIQSGGLYGQSTLRYLYLNNLTVQKEVKLNESYFGEGCDLIHEIDGNDYVYQLTWREKTM